jgi:hypothetical protein
MLPQIYKFARVYPLEVYHSALAWLPLQSKIRETYDRHTRSVFSGLRDQKAVNRFLLKVTDAILSHFLWMASIWQEVVWMA